jgi:hypothetical protein
MNESNQPIPSPEAGEHDVSSVSPASPVATKTKAATVGRHAYRPAQPESGTVGQTRDAWTVWILSIVTLGIFYLVWYYKINRELQLFAPDAVTVRPGLAVLAQLVPIVNLVSLARTAGRLNAAHETVESPVRVSAGITVLGAFWYVSQTRYLQRRLNTLWQAAALPG